VKRAREKFADWSKTKDEFFKEFSVTTTFVKYEKSENEIANPNTAIIHESDKYMGEVFVWESGQMEYGLIKKEDPNNYTLWNYIEKIDNEPNYEAILNDYLSLLCELDDEQR